MDVVEAERIVLEGIRVDQERKKERERGRVSMGPLVRKCNSNFF